MYGRGSGTKRTTTGGGMSAGGRIALGLLRAALISTLVLLLLEPLIRSFQLDREEAVVILLMDESASILKSSDSLRSQSDLRAWPLSLSESLQVLDVNLETFGFSDELTFHNLDHWPTAQWQGNQTNLETALAALEARFENRNLAGFVLASDGLINRGAQPEFSDHWPSTPLYTIGLGDTTIRKDRWIERVDHNRVAYLGNSFPVETVVQAQGMAELEITISVHIGSSALASKTWRPSSNSTSKRFEFTLPAEGLGLQRYEMRCSIDSREVNLENNRFPFYVEVLESKRQVVVISDAPHPDINAIVLALQDQEQTEVTIFHTTNLQDASRLLQAIEKADVLIAHNVLGQFFGASTWPQLIQANQKPCWWILSDEASQSSLRSMTQWGIRLEQSAGLSERHQVRVNSNFGLFDIPEALESACRQWPPMQGPFGSLTWSPAWSPLLYRQLGTLETDQSCWAVRESSGDQRMAVTIGQGFWNWRMRNYVQYENHKNFNDLVQKHVQFLGSQNKRNRLNVSAPKSIEVDQRLELTAEVYDAALMPVVGASIRLLLKSDDGAEFPFEFSARNQRYALDAGRLQEGSYTWTASCQLDQQAYEQTGTFIVLANQAELTSKPADHDLLLRLAESKGGSFCGTLDNSTADRVVTAMQKAGIPSAILHEQIQLDELIAWDWILWCILAMLTIEWVIRRRAFGY